MEEKALTVIDETEILGKKIKMYGTIEYPYFVFEHLEYLLMILCFH